MYTCERCGYESPRKLNYERHINRKNPCKMKIQQPVLEKTEEDIERVDTNRYEPVRTNIENEPSRINRYEPVRTKNFQCEYCEKTFVNNSSLNRHLKSRCKIKEKEDDKLRIKELELQLEIEKREREKQLEKKVKDMEDQLQLQREETEKIVDKLLARVGDVHNTTNVSNTNNIILNDFGKESIKHLTDNLLEWCSIMPTQRVPQLTEFIHFHDKAPPENKNLRIENKNKSIISIRERGKWVYKEKNDIVDKLLDRNMNLLDEYYENNDENITDFSKERYERFRNDDERTKKVKKNIELNILSNS